MTKRNIPVRDNNLTRALSGNGFRYVQKSRPEWLRWQGQSRKAESVLPRQGKPTMVMKAGE